MILKDLLIQRLIILNLCGAAGLVWAWQQGHVETVIVNDTSYISIIIAALFAVGLASVFNRGIKVSRALNERKLKDDSSESVDGVKFLAKSEHITEIAKWLAALGMLGTCIGLLMMAFSVDADSIATIEGLKTAIGPLITGWGVALITTIVGIIFGVWLEINALILRTASISMIQDSSR